MDAASRTNQYQMHQQSQKVQEAPKEEWKCECGETNKGNFCSACGKKRPEDIAYHCDKCGYEPPKQGNIPKFCPECGDTFNEADKK
jgi:membrane protease subunit (stomatin/prohibitin family)